MRGRQLAWWLAAALAAALAGCSGETTAETADAGTSSATSEVGERDWFAFGYGYCGTAIADDGGLNADSGAHTGQAVLEARFGEGAPAGAQGRIVAGCNRAYAEAVRVLQGRPVDDWRGDGYAGCKAALESGGGFEEPGREPFAAQARDNGALGDEIEEYADGCEAAYAELAPETPPDEPPDEPAERVSKCGNRLAGGEWTDEQVLGAGDFNLTARNLSCAAARALVNGIQYEADPPYRPYAPGWSCRYVRNEYELVDIRCISGEKVVRWQSGA